MFRRILVPVDGSELAEKALPYAESLAKNFEAELILMQVLQRMPEFVGGPHGVVLHEQLIPDRQLAENYMSHLSQQVYQKGGVRVRTVTQEAHSVADAINRFVCDEAVDLVVMSTHGRSGLSRLVYGSVAGQVLRDVPCPVFLVRVSDADCE